MAEIISISAESGEPVEPAPGSERLWREVVGEQIRRLRQDRRQRLADVAGSAGISAQYLSEIERGVKDPSSEMLAAVAGALQTTVDDLVLHAYWPTPVVPLTSVPSPGRDSGSSGPVCLAA